MSRLGLHDCLVGCLFLSEASVVGYLADVSVPSRVARGKSLALVVAANVDPEIPQIKLRRVIVGAVRIERAQLQGRLMVVR